MINKTLLMSGAEYFDDGHAINPYMNASVAIDRAKATKEHDSIRQAFENAGIKVYKVPAPKDCQDGVYTANWALVRGNVAVMSALPNWRQTETPYAEKVLKDLGKKIVYIPEALDVQASSSWAFSGRGMERAVSEYSEVNPAGQKRSGAEEASRVGGSADKYASRPGRLRFSGQGDALPCGDYLFIGSNYRTDAAVHDFVGHTLGYKVISLQTVPKRLFGFGPAIKNKASGWPDSFFYDCDLAISILKPNLIAWCRSAFTKVSQAKIDALTDIEKIEVSMDEAKNGFACNLVSTGETVIMSDSAPLLKAAIEAKGLRVITPHASELKKGGGYIRCVSLTLD